MNLRKILQFSLCLSVFPLLLCDCTHESNVAGGEDFPNSLEPISQSLREELARGDSSKSISTQNNLESPPSVNVLARAQVMTDSTLSVDSVGMRILQIRRDSTQVLGQAKIRIDSLGLQNKGTWGAPIWMLQSWHSVAFLGGQLWMEELILDQDGDGLLVNTAVDSNHVLFYKFNQLNKFKRKEWIHYALFKDSLRNHPLKYDAQEFWGDSTLVKIKARSLRDSLSIAANDTVSVIVHRFKNRLDTLIPTQEARQKQIGIGDQASLVSVELITRNRNDNEKYAFMSITLNKATSAGKKLESGNVMAQVQTGAGDYRFEGYFTSDSLIGVLQGPKGDSHRLRVRR